MLKALPSGKSSFSAIREGNWLYVDKTEAIYRVATAGKYFSLSRPRCFGKSLTVSALKALFEGRRELFEGLRIHEHGQWNQEETFPVISVSFNGLDYKTNGLEKALSAELENIALAHGLASRGLSSKDKFRELILTLGQTGKVVILIDEYDKPINDFLDDYEQADAHREILGNFYGMLKANDVADCLRFVFITGVSKFSKVTLFSELNNLTGLTQHDEFGTLTGITQTELETYFSGHIEKLAHKTGLSREATLDKIKLWYNGYTWDGRNFLYNPFSLLGLFGSGTFRNYWFTSGSAGWLVRKSLFDQLFQTYANTPVSEVSSLMLRVRAALLEHNLEEFIALLRGIFADISNRLLKQYVEADDLKLWEAYYQTVIYLTLHLTGSQIACEVQTNRGYIDAVA